MTHRDVGFISPETYQDKLRWAEELEELLGELECQHRSETAHFGDSWPGAQVQISDLRRDLEALNHDLVFMRVVLETSDELPEPAEPGFEDIPF